jgi:hypothetical protein
MILGQEEMAGINKPERGDPAVPRRRLPEEASKGREACIYRIDGKRIFMVQTA